MMQNKLRFYGRWPYTYILARKGQNESQLWNGAGATTTKFKQ